MTTLLEHHFHFSADDLAANQLGELSERQRQQDKHILRARRKKHLQSLFLFSLVAIGFIGLGYLPVVLALLAISTVLVNRPLQQIKRFGAKQAGTVQTIHKVRRRDFLQSTTDPVPQYTLTHYETKITIHYRQWNALDPNATYDIFYYSRPRPTTGEMNPNPIVAIQQHGGSSPQMPMLEHLFDFSPDDLAANRNEQLSEDQSMRIKAMIHNHYAWRNHVFLRTSLWIFLIIIYLLFPLSRDATFNIGRLAFEIAILVFITVGWKPIMLPQIIEIAYNSKKAESHEPIQKSKFKPLRLATIKMGQVYPYYFKGRGIGLVLTTEQYEALDENAIYRFYYFPSIDFEDSNPILAVEKVADEQYPRHI